MQKKHPKVLVGSVLKPEDDEFWGKNLDNLYNSLTYPNKEFAKLVSEEEPIEGLKYSTHSKSRNRFIDTYLKDDIDYVFWVDADIVDLDHNDIIEKLLEIDSENIIAPYVFIDPCEENIWKSYSRFFDISFYIDHEGNRYNFRYPYHKTPKKDLKYSCQSVGTCMLVPAKIYREGCRYDPYSPDGDHVSFCKAAMEKSYKIFSTDEIIIFHAYLPKYGKNFR